MILSQKRLTRSRELKQEVPDGLLLRPVGAFIPVMDQDTRTVSQATGLKLQMAGEVDDPVMVAVSRFNRRTASAPTPHNAALANAHFLDRTDVPIAVVADSCE